MTNQEISTESKRLNRAYNKTKDETEQDAIFKKIKELEGKCSHPELDRNSAGGVFCSVCDKTMWEYFD